MKKRYSLIMMMIVAVIVASRGMVQAGDVVMPHTFEAGTPARDN